MTKCKDCRNLINICLESAFAWFEEKKRCKAKNMVFEDYCEVEKIRECEDYDPHEIPSYIRVTAAEDQGN